jgi:CCR4-NOT transcription complex subunit 7/8
MKLATSPSTNLPLDTQDTEFPGIVARPMGNFKTGADYHYQTMRCNVDILKLIQLGVTLSDEDGNLPDACTWQFNFKFNIKSVDTCLPRSRHVRSSSDFSSSHLKRGHVCARVDRASHKIWDRFQAAR